MDDATWKEADLATYLASCGLTWVTPEHLARMKVVADNVRSAGAALRRQPSKYNEPAHVFDVPAKTYAASKG